MNYFLQKDVRQKYKFHISAVYFSATHLSVVIFHSHDTTQLYGASLRPN